MKILLTVFTILLAIGLVAGLQGIDTDSFLQTATYQCIKSKGNLFAIIRGSTGSGQVDSNAVQNLYNAAGAAMLTDVKLIPCRGKSAISQAEQFMNRIRPDLFNTVWIEVMPNLHSGCSWEGLDPASHCRFVLDIADVLSRKDKHIGIFSSIQDWKTIFKSTEACKELGKYEIWYSHNDNADDFSDYAEFGGWEVPRLKQFQLGTTLCGAKVNLNYHPSA